MPRTGPWLWILLFAQSRLDIPRWRWRPKDGRRRQRGDLLPNLKTKIASAELLSQDQTTAIQWNKSGDWVVFDLPARAPEKLVSVIELKLASKPDVDPTWALDPQVKTEILAEFATVENAEQSEKRWMEKFGEWKRINRVHQWKPDGRATWEVDVLEPGDYYVDLTYAGEGRLVWQVAIEGGEQIQNQQNSSHNYQSFPIGLINFPKAGRHKVSVSCVEGDAESASLKAIDFKKM